MSSHVRRVSRLVFCAPVLIAMAACRDSGPDVKPATITISPAPAGGLTIASGASINLSFSVVNAAGDPVPGQTVSWVASDPTVVSVSASGVLTGGHVGQANVAARVGDITSPAVSVTVTPGAAARVAIRTQPAGGTSGAPFVTQPVVEIQDAAGNLVTTSTAVVTAIIVTGGGTITGSTAAAVGGVATFASLTVTGTIGDRTLGFSAPGTATATSAGFSLAPGTPARLVVRTQPAGAMSGAPLQTQPVIEIRDGAGNLVVASSLAVSAGIGNGDGTLANGAATASAGLATFSGLTISGLPGERTLTFSAPGLPTISSASFLLDRAP
jgi:hypothetical protein